VSIERVEQWIEQTTWNNKMHVSVVRILKAALKVLPGDHNEIYGDNHIYKCESNYGYSCNCGMDNFRDVVANELKP